MRRVIAFFVMLMCVFVPAADAQDTGYGSMIAFMDSIRCSSGTFGADNILFHRIMDWNEDEYRAHYRTFAPVYYEAEGEETLYWTLSADRAIVGESGLVMADSCIVHESVFFEGTGFEKDARDREYVLELYTGTEPGYLVIACDETRIVCMQYVNVADSKMYYENAGADGNIYCHYIRGTNATNGSKYVRKAYFVDRTCVELTYDAGTDELRQIQHYTDNGSLIKYFDVCTAESGFATE